MTDILKQFMSALDQPRPAELLADAIAVNLADGVGVLAEIIPEAQRGVFALSVASLAEQALKDEKNRLNASVDHEAFEAARIAADEAAQEEARDKRSEDEL